MTDLLMFGTMGGAIVLLAVFVVLRDAALAKKMSVYENAFEVLNKNLFLLEKKVKAGAGPDEIEASIASRLLPVTQSFVSVIKELQENETEFQKNIDSRLATLEERYKALFTPSSDLGGDDKRIMAMHGQGYSAEEIARELRVSVGSVEFVLRLNGRGDV